MLRFTVCEYDGDRTSRESTELVDMETGRCEFTVHFYPDEQLAFVEEDLSTQVLPSTEFLASYGMTMFNPHQSDILELCERADSVEKIVGLSESGEVTRFDSVSEYPDGYPIDTVQLVINGASVSYGSGGKLDMDSEDKRVLEEFAEVMSVN